MNIIKKYINFTNSKKGFTNTSKVWKKYLINDIPLSVQPGLISNYIIDNDVENITKKIYKLSKNYFLVNNQVEFYSKEYKDHEDKDIFSYHLKFRLSDSEYMDANIPQDIRSEIIKDMRNVFGKSYHIEVDDFPDRGYILFDIIVWMDPRV